MSITRGLLDVLVQRVAPCQTTRRALGGERKVGQDVLIGEGNPALDVR